MSGGSVHAMSEAMPAQLVKISGHTGSSLLDLAVPVTISTS